MTPKFVLAIRYMMAVSFMVMAGCVIAYKEKTQLSEFQTYSFAILLFVYGCFRVYRASKFSDDIFREK